MVETGQESYQTIADRAVNLQAGNMRFFQSFFEAWNETLREQVETNRIMAQNLIEQALRQQEALRTLVPESVSAYLNFLNSWYLMLPGGRRARTARK